MPPPAAAPTQQQLQSGTAAAAAAAAGGEGAAAGISSAAAAAAAAVAGTGGGQLHGSGGFLGGSMGQLLGLGAQHGSALSLSDLFRMDEDVPQVSIRCAAAHRVLLCL